MGQRIRKAALRGIVAMVLLVFCFESAGCPDAYRAAADATDDVANGVDKAVSAVGELYVANLITRDEKNAAAGVLLSLTNLNTEFRGNVKAIHSRGGLKADYLAAASGFVQSGRNLLASGDLHVKNADAQKKIDAALAAIQAGLDGVQLAIQKSKG